MRRVYTNVTYRCEGQGRFFVDGVNEIRVNCVPADLPNFRELLLNFNLLESGDVLAEIELEHRDEQHLHVGDLIRMEKVASSVSTAA